MGGGSSKILGEGTKEPRRESAETRCTIARRGHRSIREASTSIVLILFFVTTSFLFGRGLVDTASASSSFGPPVRVNADAANDQGAPAVAPLPFQEPFIAWQDARCGSEDIYTSRSHNNFTSYGPDKRADDSLGSSSQIEPAVAVASNGTIYVVWQDNRRNAFDYDIYLTKSTDGGATFKRNVKVDDSNVSKSSWQERPSIAVTSKGDIYVAWQDDRTGQIRIRGALSTNGGSSFSASREISPTASVNGQSGVQLLSQGDKIFAVFMDTPTGTAHPYLSISPVGGKAFSTAVRLDSTGLPGAAQRDVCLSALPSGGIVAAWSDSRNGDWDVYMTYVSPTGSVARDFKVSDGVLGDNQESPAIATDQTGNIYTAWQDDRDSLSAVRFAYLEVGGIKFTPSVNVAVPGPFDTQRRPALISTSPGHVLIAWQDDKGGTDDVFSSYGAVTLNQAPSVTPLESVHASYGAVLSMSATAYDPEGDPLIYTWDFGDGSPFATGARVTHIYSAPGFYTLTVHVADNHSHNVSASAPVSITFPLVLQAGWNLVSIPVTGVSYTSDTLPGLQMGDMVASWDSAGQRYDPTFVKGISSPASAFGISSGVGYWIYVGTARTILLEGALPTTTIRRAIDVPSDGGWATVGISSLAAGKHASDLLPMITGASVTSMLRYDPATGRSTVWIPNFPWLNNFELVPGHAYSVYVTGSCTLTVST